MHKYHMYVLLRGQRYIWYLALFTSLKVCCQMFRLDAGLMLRSSIMSQTCHQPLQYLEWSYPIQTPNYG